MLVRGSSRDIRVLIRELGEHVGESTLINGTVSNVREFKHHSFVIVTDRTGAVQCVFEKSEVGAPPLVGSTVRLKGNVSANEKSRAGFELVANEVEVLSSPAVELAGTLDRPLESSLDYQLDNRAISLRNILTRDVFLAQSKIAKAFRSVMEEEGCVEVHTPKIVSGGTEGGAEVFQVDYFGGGASLAQSPQLYKQIAAGALERVYEIGAVFRAENSKTNRHLTEFTGLDFEVAFIDSQHDLMDIEEKFVRRMLAELEKGETLLASSEIPRISWDEANALINKHGTKDRNGNFDKSVGDAAMKEFGARFVFVFEYPKDEKPFYIKRLKNNPERTHSFDLLFDGLEISSGGERISDFAELRESMIAHGLDPDDNPGYMQAFEAGMPPHGGAGMGLERITQNVLGLKNIREATLFPRDVKRLLP